MEQLEKSLEGISQIANPIIDPIKMDIKEKPATYEGLKKVTDQPYNGGTGIMYWM